MPRLANTLISTACSCVNMNSLKATIIKQVGQAYSGNVGQVYSGANKHDLDAWLAYYNNERTHHGKMDYGCASLQTPIAGKEAWDKKVTHLNLI